MPGSIVPAPVLPRFKYHPDPVGTGSIARSSEECAACHVIRGWTYLGPIYGQFDDEPAICPWCIADGTAHRVLDVEFFDSPAVGGYGDWASVPQAVVEEICFRTPAFSGWQQERWYTHCSDAAEFLGGVGLTELRNLDTAAYDAIAEETGLTGNDLVDYMTRLDKDNSPTAYLFRCRTCRSWGGYSDIR